MKKIFLFITLLAWIGFSASAQVVDTSKRSTTERSNKNKSHVDKMTQDTSKYDRMSDHYLLKDGKIVHMNKGVETPFDEEKEINGIRIRPNGDVMMKDNKTVRLRENQYIDAKGKFHSLPKVNDQ